jgi:acylphosphatase
MARVRYRVYFSGRVQGVGFRDTSQRLALLHVVGGYVRNLPDGRVELVAEGEQEAADGLLAAIGRRMQRYISDTQVLAEPPGETPPSEFAIRF